MVNTSFSTGTPVDDMHDAGEHGEEKKGKTDERSEENALKTECVLVLRTFVVFCPAFFPQRVSHSHYNKPPSGKGHP